MFQMQQQSHYLKFLERFDVMKKILVFIIYILLCTKSFADDEISFGYGMYVGGINVADAKAELNINEQNEYSFKALVFSQGFTKIFTGFSFITESKGKIIKDKVQFSEQISSSISNFGDTHTILKHHKDKNTIVKYPNPEEVKIASLPGNPFLKANDPISSILTLMQQIKFYKKCNINVVVVTNHYMYEVNSSSTTSKVLEADSYNLASGKAISCVVKFKRLDKQDNISAYNDLNKGEEHKSTNPIFHFMKLSGIPFYIPVSIEATEKRFGAFRLNLQFVKYKDKVYRVNQWNDQASFPQETIDKLKLVPSKLLKNN